MAKKRKPGITMNFGKGVGGGDTSVYVDYSDALEAAKPKPLMGKTAPYTPVTDKMIASAKASGVKPSGAFVAGAMNPDVILDSMNARLSAKELPFKSINEGVMTVGNLEKAAGLKGATAGTIGSVQAALKATSEKEAQAIGMKWWKKWGIGLKNGLAKHPKALGVIGIAAWIAAIGLSAYKNAGKERIRGAKHELDLQDATLGALTPESAAAGGQADQLSQMNMMLLQGLTGATPPPQQQPPSSSSGGLSEQEMQMLLQALQQR